MKGGAGPRPSGHRCLYASQGRERGNGAVRTARHLHSTLEQALGAIEPTLKLGIDLGRILVAIKIEKTGLGYHRTTGLHQRVNERRRAQGAVLDAVAMICARQPPLGLLDSVKSSAHCSFF